MGKCLLFYFLCLSLPQAIAHEVQREFNPDEKNFWATPPLKVEKLRIFKKSDGPKLIVGCVQRHEAGDCRNWGIALSAMGQTDQARKMWEIGCRLDDLSSCFNLGLLHYRLRHPRSAEVSWEKSCEENHPKACYFLGLLAEEEKREKPMQIFYRKACDLGVGRACADLAKWLRQTNGELMFARELDIYACKEGLQENCPYRQTHHRWSQRTLRDIHTDTGKNYHD